MTKYLIFTDGSAVVKGKCICEKTDCPKCNQWGGFGVYMQLPNGKEKAYSKGFTHTKTGRMEISAVLLALRNLPKDKVIDVHFYSDSEYVVNAFNKDWLSSWKRIGWIGKKNVDLWRQVVTEKELRPKMRFRISHVKGHQKDLNDPIVFGNTVADDLADYKKHEKRERDLK